MFCCTNLVQLKQTIVIILNEYAILLNYLIIELLNVHDRLLLFKVSLLRIGSYVALLTLECWFSSQILIWLLFCHPGSWSGPMVKIQVKRLWRWFRGLIRSEKMLPYHHMPLENPPFAALLLFFFSVVKNTKSRGVISYSVLLTSTLTVHTLNNVFVFPLWMMED